MEITKAQNRNFVKLQIEVKTKDYGIIKSEIFESSTEPTNKIKTKDGKEELISDYEMLINSFDNDLNAPLCFNNIDGDYIVIPSEIIRTSIIRIIYLKK